MIKKIINWILYSSSRTEYYSATVKGFITFVPSIVIFLSLIKIQVSPAEIQGLLLALAMVISLVGTVVSALWTLYGAARKVFLTVLGENDAINNPES